MSEAPGPPTLATLRAGQRLRGLVTGQTVTLIAIDPIDAGLSEVFYRDASGRSGARTITDADAARLEIAADFDSAPAFDADPDEFRLAAEALRTLMQGAIAPVDLAQAAIGPGISVFSRYSRVREADGSDMSVREALLLINSTLDEVLGEQESDFAPDTRFAVKWYRQYGWGQESSGIADQLARASDTSIGALERGGIFEAKGGKARLLSPALLSEGWDPAQDQRLSVWEATVRLAAAMDKDGVDKVAELLPSVQARLNLDAVKELGFLLFHEAEKRKDAKDALLFNGLVSAWGDVNEQARKYAATPRPTQQAFDFDEEEE